MKAHAGAAEYWLFAASTGQVLFTPDDLDGNKAEKFHKKEKQNK